MRWPWSKAKKVDDAFDAYVARYSAALKKSIDERMEAAMNGRPLPPVCPPDPERDFWHSRYGAK